MTGPEGRPGDAMTSWRRSMLGVDLGTSHTVAMLRWPDGRTRPLLFDGQPLMPSAVYLDTTGRLHVGRDAQRLGHAEPARVEPNPKRHIDADSVFLGGSEVPVADLFAALLGAVAREAVAAAGFLPPAVLTYPAAWGARRRAVLIEALGTAGWPAGTRLVPEPVAAARYFADVLHRPVPVGSALAVFDFGGGTLDVAVVRNEGLGPDGHPRFAVAASGGADDLGGLDLDAVLVDHLGKSLAGAEPEAWAALTEPATLAQWRARRQFWEDIRGAKEMLSRSALAPVPVPGVEHAVHLTRDELEAAAGPLIRRGVTEAAAVIKAAGLSPPELAGLFLVGGSSRVPMVARLLHSELGVAPTVLEQPELPVAEGAIMAVAEGEWRGSAGASALSTGDLPGTAPHELADMAPTSPARAGATPADAAGVSRPGPIPAGAWTDQASADPAPGASAELAEAAAAHGHGAPGGHGPGDDVRYRPGVAAAATPTPTPPTVPKHPPAAREQTAPTLPDQPPAPHGGPEPQYAEPVDPWATGEAAAFAAAGGAPIFPASGAPVGPAAHGPQPWLASTHPDHGPAGSSAAPGGDARVPAYRKKWFWLVAAALAVVVGVGTTLAVMLWPGYPALDYRALDASKPVTFAPAAPVSSGFQDTAIVGDRAYFASVSEDPASATGVSGDETLGVVAADTRSGKRLWQNTKAGKAERWEQMIALPQALVVFTDTNSTTGKRRMAVLGAERGDLLWQRTIDNDDGVLFSADVAVLVDRVENRLLGLGLADGKQRWEQRNVRTDYGTSTSVVAATTPADLSGPAGVSGVAFSPDLTDDTRIVQVAGDKSFRVIDAENGDVLVPPRQGVADPSDEMIAHNGRFVVRESTGGSQRLLAYDLTTPGEPDVLFSAPANVQISELTPCGDDRVCWIETTDFNLKTTQVAGLNVAESGGVRRRAVPNADSLAPVGEHVLATQSTSPSAVSLIDPDGKQVWNVPGRAARLDGGNLLRFNQGLSTTPDNPALHGEHLGDDAVPLGALNGVRSATCSWNTSVIACMADETFMVQRFAD